MQAMAIRTVRARAGMRRRVSVMLLLATVGVGACDSVDAAQREHLLDTPAVQRVVGVWAVSIRADSQVMTNVHARGRTITGTMAFTVNHHGPRDILELSGVTHQGVHDLDFVPFGWASGTIDAPAVAVARVVPASADGGRANQPDSIYVVMSPGTTQFAVRMTGLVNADSAWGVWSASSFSAGGGAGSFVMRRHP